MSEVVSLRNPVLEALTDEELAQGLREHGNAATLAQHLRVPPTTLKRRLRRAGLSPTSQPSTASTERRLSRAGLLEALKPPNLCPVKAFLERLDPEDRKLVQEAMSRPTDPRLHGAMPHDRLLWWLTEGEGGFEEVPTLTQIINHRSGKGSCRCRG